MKWHAWRVIGSDGICSSEHPRPGSWPCIAEVRHHWRSNGRGRLDGRTHARRIWALRLPAPRSRMSIKARMRTFQGSLALILVKDLALDAAAHWCGLILPWTGQFAHAVEQGGLTPHFLSPNLMYTSKTSLVRQKVRDYLARAPYSQEPSALDLVCLTVKRTLRASEKQRPVVGISGALSTRDCPPRSGIRESV